MIGRVERRLGREVREEGCEGKGKGGMGMKGRK
jgi:hypothetical protein